MAASAIKAVLFQIAHDLQLGAGGRAGGGGLEPLEQSEWRYFNPQPAHAVSLCNFNWLPLCFAAPATQQCCAVLRRHSGHWPQRDGLGPIHRNPMPSLAALAGGEAGAIPLHKHEEVAGSQPVWTKLGHHANPA